MYSVFFIILTFKNSVEGGERLDVSSPVNLVKFKNEAGSEIGEWYHIALVVDRANETVEYFVNGRSVLKKAPSYAEKNHTGQG